MPILYWALGQNCRATGQLGWDTLANGELLRVAGFDVLLTTDKNHSYQRKLKDRKIAIVVLGRNRWSIVKAVLPQLVAAVNGAAPGSYVIVDVPDE